MLAQTLSAFPEVDRVILFGSRARGDNRERADIDLAVECPGAGILQWFDMLDAVDTAPTLLKVDLVRLDQAPDELAQVIRTEGRVLYER